jgi:hypothetical protein
MLTPQYLEARAARHESAHAWFGHTHGLTVEQVTLHPKAETVVTVSFAPEDLPQYARQMPRNAALIVQNICAMVLAGPLATDHVIAGQDLLTLQEWKTAWELACVPQAPQGSTWDYVATMARSAVLLWLSRGDVKYAIDALTRELIRAGSLDAATWQKLAREALTRPRAPQVTVSPGIPIQRSAHAPRALTRGYLPHEGLPDWRAASHLQGVLA